MLQACDILKAIIPEIVWNNTDKNLVSIFFAFETDKLYLYYPGCKQH